MTEFSLENAYDLRIQNSKQKFQPNGYFTPKILFDSGFGRKMFPIEKYITLGRVGDVLKLFYDSNELKFIIHKRCSLKFLSKYKPDTLPVGYATFTLLLLSVEFEIGERKNKSNQVRDSFLRGESAKCFIFVLSLTSFFSDRESRTSAEGKNAFYYVLKT